MNENIIALNVKTAAARLGVSERFIAKLIASGVLPSLKLGRRRLIRESAIRALLESREAPAA